MAPARDQIMDALIRSPGCLVEEIVLECQDLTWNQVFTEIERMSRTGLVRLSAKGPGLYTVTRTMALKSPETEEEGMKTQAAKEPAGRQPHAPTRSRQPARPTQESIHSQPVSVCDDLQARIARRAYELHAERGYRYGYALDDWVEAEREIIGSECSAS